MFHFPIQNTQNPNNKLEFSHIMQEVPAGLWKKENVISLDSIKLNVFVEGSFSVMTDGVLHKPIYGDICCLPPRKMHYGQILEPMYIEYYQLDVGVSAISFLPDGDRLVKRLIDATENQDSFVRPLAETAEKIITLCQSIESAISDEELSLAFAKSVELLNLILPIYLNLKKSYGAAPTLHTARAIGYIEKRFSEDITLGKLSAHLGVSESFISRSFKKDLGVTVHGYINHVRILKALEILKDQTVTETAYACGFSDTSHFISVFKKYMKTTPMKYKKDR